jgi:hypothetical protein
VGNEVLNAIGPHSGEWSGKSRPEAQRVQTQEHHRPTAGSVEVRDSYIHLSEPKTAKGRRSIDLPAIAVEALRKHKAAMRAEGFGDVPWVFCSTRGGRSAAATSTPTASNRC